MKGIDFTFTIGTEETKKCNDKTLQQGKKMVICFSNWQQYFDKDLDFVFCFFSTLVEISPRMCL
jgi:hypothetical protein